MGRRDHDTRNLEKRKADTGKTEPPHRAWEAVRRALGRLIATGCRARSADIPTDADHCPAFFSCNRSADDHAGTQEGTWRAVSQVRQTAAPQALTGGGHGSLLPTVQVVERNAALTPPVCCSMPPVSGAACLVENADLLVPGFVIALPEAFLKLPPVPVRVESVALLTLSSTALSRGKKLSGWSLDAPKVSTLRLPRLTAPRILWGGDAVLSRIALTRLCREAPLDVPFALAFGAEERRLAEATQLPSGDVTLLGVYPGVPLLAVSRIVVADEGRSLRLWLKPEVLRARSAPRLITLLVGRQVSSGKILQAVL